MEEKHFYKNLHLLKVPITRVFSPTHFSAIPNSWYIIISDIKNSTDAVNVGRSNDVNLVAAGSLIAALNVARKYEIEIPFFFGGDGGTIIVPEIILEEVSEALLLHKTNSLMQFNLDMHIGSVSMKDVNAAGHFVKICKLQIGSGFNKPVVIGDGLHYAEQLVKSAEYNFSSEVHEEKEPDLSGLECRWDKVKPPEEQNEIVCYLIQAVNPLKQIEVYREVLIKMDSVYGNIKKRNPLSLKRMKLLLTYSKVRKEMMVKYGKWRIGYFLLSFIKSFLGSLAFKYNLTINNFKGRKYLELIIENADTLTIDGRITTVITGTMNKRVEYIKQLSMLE